MRLCYSSTVYIYGGHRSASDLRGGGCRNPNFRLMAKQPFFNPPGMPRLPLIIDPSSSMRLHSTSTNLSRLVPDFHIGITTRKAGIFPNRKMIYWPCNRYRRSTGQDYVQDVAGASIHARCWGLSF